jgi:hypothetical protein
VSDSGREWGGSLHLTFRLLPEPAGHLRPFLESDGLHKNVVLDKLPYDASRASGGGGGSKPDAKRYRDARQVYQTVGLLYEDDGGEVRITELGAATLRWLEIVNQKNALILGRHAAYALSACQLRHPSRAGRKYNDDVLVFPFAFIWRAMLALDGRISSGELNRAIFRVTNEHDLEEAIAAIAKARALGDESVLGDETITGRSKNDRIIPWVALASFGWTLFPDKRTTNREFYELPARSRDLVAEAAAIRRRHIEFDSIAEYVGHVSRAAALPPDMR